MPLHPLSNFGIQKYYQNEPKFNGVYSKNNLPKIKDGEYVLNLDGSKLIGAHWITLYVNNNSLTYFDSFGVKHMPKEVKNIIENKNIIASIYRI